MLVLVDPGLESVGRPLSSEVLPSLDLLFRLRQRIASSTSITTRANDPMVLPMITGAFAWCFEEVVEVVGDAVTEAVSLRAAWSVQY